MVSQRHRRPSAGGQLGILSRKRDAYATQGTQLRTGRNLCSDQQPERHLGEGRERLSPRQLCDLLKLSGEQVCDYFNSLDPDAIGGPVDWAGPEPVRCGSTSRANTPSGGIISSKSEMPSANRVSRNRGSSRRCSTHSCARSAYLQKRRSKDGTIVALTISGDSGGRWLCDARTARGSFTSTARARRMPRHNQSRDAWRFVLQGNK